MGPPIDPRPSAGGTEATPDAGTVFDLLSRHRRRIVMDALLEHRELAIADLAELVASRKRDVAFATIEPEEALETYTTLCHVDIPKLADGGLLAHDEDRDLVRLAPAADALDGFIFDG